MNFIRRHLSYANVVSTIALFLVLGGATAFAAKQLAKNSVGTKQLKNNAVTAAKIKSGAVIGAKLGEGSVTADKIAPGVLPQPLPNPLPGVPAVHRLHNVTSLEFPVLTAGSQPIPLPLPNATFTQAAGEDDLIVASLEVHIPASCVSPRSATANLRIDTGSGRSADESLGHAIIEDPGAGEETATAQFVGGEVSHGVLISAPSAATQRTFSVELNPSTCNGKGGVPSHIVATGVQIDVIGFK